MASKLAVAGLAAVALVVGAAGALAYNAGGPPHVVTYITSPATLQDVQSTVLATGTLEPSNIVDVGAQTSGQLQSLTVQVGDQVTKDQQVGQIDPTLLANAVRSAQTQVDSVATTRANMQAQLGLAQSEVNRQHTLLDQGFSSPVVVEKAETALKSMQANIASMESSAANTKLALDAAKTNLEKANIRSPIDGVIAEILVKEGATINSANSTQVILRVAKMDLMTVRAQISEADVMKIRNGQPVYFTVLGEPDVRYEGKLRQLGFSPSTDLSKGSTVKNAIYYNALLDLPNKDGQLRPGMTTNVHLVLGEAKKTLTIPAVALGQRMGKDSFVVRVQNDGGQISQRQITTGLSDSLTVQVKSGLKQGEKVVVGEVMSDDPRAPKRPRFSLLGFKV